MNEQNLNIILTSLAVRIRDLELEITVKDYRIAELEAENKELKEKIKNA